MRSTWRNRCSKMARAAPYSCCSMCRAAKLYRSIEQSPSASCSSASESPTSAPREPGRFRPRPTGPAGEPVVPTVAAAVPETVGIADADDAPAPATLATAAWLSPFPCFAACLARIFAFTARSPSRRAGTCVKPPLALSASLRRPKFDCVNHSDGLLHGRLLVQ